jgi:hypothetical protein
MANAKTNLKRGMGGSRCARGRRDLTEVLKKDSKTRRRRQDVAEAQRPCNCGSGEPVMSCSTDPNVWPCYCG